MTICEKFRFYFTLRFDWANSGILLEFTICLDRRSEQLNVVKIMCHDRVTMTSTLCSFHFVILHAIHRFCLISYCTKLCDRCDHRLNTSLSAAFFILFSLFFFTSNCYLWSIAKKFVPSAECYAHRLYS